MRYFALTAVLIIACGDDSEPVDAATDTSLDVSELDTAVADASDDVPMDVPVDTGPVDCATGLAETNPFLLAPGFRGTQLHPAAAFDGDSIWVALTVVEEAGSAFDIAFTRVDCAGTPDDPTIVTQAVPPNDIDASIAIGSESVLVAWQRDESTGTITTWTRAFDLDGAPLGDEIEYVSLREDEPVVGTVWFPELQARDGGFWLTGARGIESLGVFQGYAQQLDTMGVATPGDALEPLAGTAQQSRPELVQVGADLHFAWNEDIGGEDQAVYLAPGAADFTLLREGFISSSVGGLVAHDEQLVAAVRVGTANGTVHLVALGDDTSAEVATGSVGAPFVAAGEGARGAILWTDDTSGFTASELWVTGYEYTAGFTVDAARQINTLGNVGLPYRPSITHLMGRFYIATWTEREGEQWQSWGQILEL